VHYVTSTGVVMNELSNEFSVSTVSLGPEGERHTSMRESDRPLNRGSFSALNDSQTSTRLNLRFSSPRAFNIKRFAYIGINVCDAL